MELLKVLALAIGLSMDAFAVSVCKGLATRDNAKRAALVCALWFGAFQALMPLIGYFLGVGFSHYIERIDHWIAFALLAFIGGNMIRESRGADEDESDSLGIKTMFLMAVATSIDALTVGITFPTLSVMPIYIAVIMIGFTTAVLSAVGVRAGAVFGTKYRSGAELIGGIILILLGCEVLLEHLGMI